MKESLVGGLEGAKEGVLMHGLGTIAGNYVSPTVAKTLEKTGLFKDGKITKIGADALADAAVFGAYPVVPALLRGELPDIAEIEAGIGTGLGFGIMKAGKTYERYSELEQQNLEDAHNSGSINSFVNASPETIIELAKSNKSSGDLLSDAMVASNEFRKKANEPEKVDAAATASTLYKSAGVKQFTEALINDKQGVIDEVQAMEIQPEAKQALLDKIEAIYPQIHPVERVKNTLGDRITEIDNRLSEISQNKAAKPVERAELDIEADELIKEREALNDGLKKTILKQREGDTAISETVQEQANAVPVETDISELVVTPVDGETITRDINEHATASLEIKGEVQTEPTEPVGEKTGSPAADDSVVEEVDFKPTEAQQAYFDTAKKYYPEMDIEAVKKQSIENAKQEGRDIPSLEDFAYAVKQITRPEEITNATETGNIEGKTSGGDLIEESQEKPITLQDARNKNPELSAEKIYGTKNSVTESLRDGMGLPPVEIPKDRSDSTTLSVWKDGARTPHDIIDNLLDPNKDIYDKSITPNDEPIMREYIKQLSLQGEELNKAKVGLQEKAAKGDEQSELDLASIDQQLLTHYDKMERALNASKIGGNIWHKYGVERQIAVDEQGLIVNAIERIKTIYGDAIPADVKRELAELQVKYDNLVARNAQIEAEIKAQAATDKYERVKPKRGLLGTKRPKKTDIEFKKEREDIIEQMKLDLKKSLGQLHATIPGAPQLNAISPHVLKLMRSFAEQGVSKVDDVVVKIHDIVKDVVVGITKEDVRNIIAGEYSDKKSLSELQKKINELKTQARTKLRIEQLENGIVVGIKRKGESSPIVKELQKELLELRKKVLNEYAELSADQLKREVRTIQNKIDKGEFFNIPVVKRKWESNVNWIKNNKEKADLTQRLKKLERDAMDSQKNKVMRTLDWGNRWGRRVIFFGANAVYTKLASAAVLGSFTHRLPEQALGRLNSKLFPHIARNAPIEGTTNATAEAKFYTEFLDPKNLASNTKDIFMTGETPLSRELGRYPHQHHIPLIDFFAADAHIMIKDPVKRATFEASLINHLNWYEKNGVDPTHPLMLESARQAAYKRAEYEIFQNSNPTKIKEFFTELEKTGIIDATKPDIWNKHIKGNAKYAASAIYHFLIPVNTVPVNILKRIGLGPKLLYNLPKAWAKNKAMREGIENMTTEECDAILVQLKKGQISAAYWTLGFILAGSSAGGLYTRFYPDKEREQTIDMPESNRLNLGININKNAQHNSQLQSLQMGATWRIVYDHYIDDKGESQLSAIIKATAATGGVAAEQHPVINTTSKVNEAIKAPYGTDKFSKDLKRRIGITKAEDVFKLMGYNIDDEGE